MVAPLLRVLCLAALAVGCSSKSDLVEDEAVSTEPRRPAKPALLGEGLASPEPPPSGAPSFGGAPNGAPPEPSRPRCGQSEPVLQSDVSNARDLGGVPLASGRVTCGKIFRGPPLQLTAAGCQRAAELGIQTVIDLRTESERLAIPDSACASASFVPAPLPIPYGLGPADYLQDLGTDESVAQVFHTFGDPGAYPVYFHCTYGRDRTGVIGALLLLTLGASRQTVMNEYLLSAPNVGAYPNALEAVLNEIERRGGPEQLLTELGISAEELAVLRAQAVAE